MDGRRMPPSDRRVINGHADQVPPRQPAEPQPTRVEQPQAATPVHHAPQHGKKRVFLRRKLPIIIGVLAVLLILGGWFAWTKIQNAATGIDSNKYQAVFFTNGQVYFGKLKSFNDDYMKLNDIYYLQTETSEEGDSQNPQQSSTNQNNVQLIKLGDEIHGPEDEMILSKDQVLFYENLKDDSRVAQSIAQHKQSN